MSFYPYDNTLSLNNSTHPIITRENNYKVNKKLLTVHANDRDVTYYPDSNFFSIKCPQAYENVQSINLIEFSIPNYINNFSDKLKNNKFYVDSSLVTIVDGNYTPQDLASYLKSKSNLSGIDISYNQNTKKFTFSSVDDFSFNINNLDFSCNINTSNSSKYEIYPQSNNFYKAGFFYNIGFDTSNGVVNSTLQDSSYILISKHSYRGRDTEPIYFEIDNFNKLYDEIYPFPNNSNNSINNQYNSGCNTAFFKIPFYVVNQQGFIYPNYSSRYAYFEPPLKKIKEFKFKFRYHDGTLVDFGTEDITFTIEITELINNFKNNVIITGPM